MMHGGEDAAMHACLTRSCNGADSIEGQIHEVQWLISLEKESQSISQGNGGIVAFWAQNRPHHCLSLGEKRRCQSLRLEIQRDSESAIYIFPFWFEI
jgi:hypothetical protein